MFLTVSAVTLCIVVMGLPSKSRVSRAVATVNNSFAGKVVSRLLLSFIDVSRGDNGMFSVGACINSSNF